MMPTVLPSHTCGEEFEIMFVVLIFRSRLPSRVSRELNRLLHLADPFPDFFLIVMQDGSLSFADGCLANLKHI